MTELKPCPFCGREAGITELTYPMKHYTVICSNEKCYAQMGDFLSKEEAIRMWNTRPNPWHTGEPTEEGWYLVWMGKINGNINEHPSVMLFENGDWASRLVANTYVAWQKITPYEEKENGHTD